MLFDMNGYYLTNPNTKDYDFAIDIINGGSNNKFKIYDLEEALRRGNLYPNLYHGYKNYEPAIVKVETEREKCLLEIQRLEFSITDLNLYLDLYPEDRNAYEVFKKYVMECKKKKEEYTRIYGPLCLDDLTDEWEWSKGVWPWEGKGL